jgi:hypothetical protein
MLREEKVSKTRRHVLKAISLLLLPPLFDTSCGVREHQTNFNKRLKAYEAKECENFVAYGKDVSSVIEKLSKGMGETKVFKAVGRSGVVFVLLSSRYLSVVVVDRNNENVEVSGHFKHHFSSPEKIWVKFLNCDGTFNYSFNFTHTVAVIVKERGTKFSLEVRTAPNGWQKLHI